ncbi:hypothetical protein ACFOWA_19445 [Pedobacter lithocola]|uniref:Type 1 periplasmic binding fold superfamily protein n=1 Tax=Pedobacter lithocola TaxID=1908239 RepID=A0ABV8PI51_9SPHI
MIKNKLKLGLIAAAAIVMSISACKKDKEVPEPDENELITKVSLKFTNSTNASDIATVTWTDPDGDGGVAPTIGTLNLKANTSYNFEVSEVLNETAAPADRNVLSEITSESFEHLWVYKPATGLNLTLVRTDKDKNNLEIGIKGTAAAGAISSGSLQVVLRHQPGAKNGTEAPGSTDFSAAIPVSIK